MTKVRVTAVDICRVETEVEENGEVWLVAYDRAGREVGAQLAIESLNKDEQDKQGLLEAINDYYNARQSNN